MGILDSKTRILDTIITVQGRSQIASGKLQVAYYSFTDQGSFYIQDTSVSASLDGTRRIYLEANSMPQDQITFESDDAGKLVSFDSSPAYVSNGQILTLAVTGTNATGQTFTPASGDTFASMADDLLNSSLDAYTNNYILGSPDIFNENESTFLLGQSQIGYLITDEAPIGSGERQNASVETIDGVFVDSRLSHLPNFQYLPPINKFRPGDTTVNLLGNYPDLNQRPQLQFSDVQQEASWAVNSGYGTTVVFEETSRQNNLICQMFEVGGNEVVKLDVIDFGLFNLAGQEITLSQRQNQQRTPRDSSILSKHVFFVGKVFTDSLGVHKFVLLFTLIFG